MLLQLCDTFISVYCAVSQQFKEKIEKKYFVEKVFAIGQISQIFAKKKKKIRRNLFRKNFCSESTQFLFVVEFLLVRHCKKI